MRQKLGGKIGQLEAEKLNLEDQFFFVGRCVEMVMQAMRMVNNRSVIGILSLQGQEENHLERRLVMETGISVPSLARAMTRDRKLQKRGCRHLDKTKPEKLVHGTNMVHVRTLNGLSQSGYGCAKRRVSCADPR